MIIDLKRSLDLRWLLCVAIFISDDLFIIIVINIIVVIIITRPKPAYRRQGLAGWILGPGYSSSSYFSGCSQRLTSCLGGSAWIRYCKLKRWLFLAPHGGRGEPTDPIEGVMIFYVSQGVPNDPREEVMIFGVSRGPPTEEVMIFGVSQGVPTDPLQEVMIFGVPLRAPTEPTKRQTDRHIFGYERL